MRTCSGWWSPYFTCSPFFSSSGIQQFYFIQSSQILCRSCQFEEFFTKDLFFLFFVFSLILFLGLLGGSWVDVNELMEMLAYSLHTRTHTHVIHRCSPSDWKDYSFWLIAAWELFGFEFGYDTRVTEKRKTTIPRSKNRPSFIVKISKNMVFVCTNF